MADHLAAGRVRDAEIAIQEEVAQAPSGEFGIARFDVGKFVDDRVLIHRKASGVRVDAIATNACVQFFGSAGFRVHSFMGAMRISRQPRCTAAIPMAAAAKAPKPLEGGRNLS
jgi:hypothetical protein